MGINGLLPLLKSIHKAVTLEKFKGKTLGVDAYGWLHRGTVACAMELAMGKPTNKFVEFAMHRVRMLQHFGVTPFIIFDGDYLPSKAGTETERAKRREESRRAGLELLNAGRTSQAYLEFQKAVDVTPEMARQLIDELKRTGVQYIVAPYEADAQMVYLERQGMIDGIISEDSDLLVFGAKCLLTKLDQYGNCIEVNKADFCACKEINLTGWSDTEFRRMAILSGCDYLASISNMGLKTAYRMVRKHKTIEKIVRMLQFDGKFHVPKGYIEAFQQAESTFLYQRVFCPKKLRLVLHTQPEQAIEEDKMPFIGADVDPEIAQGVARGDLNPMTKLPIVAATRSKMVTSFSPWTRPQDLRRPRSADPKRGVPIQEFFKPKRIPLAELDPNAFTLTPSQQAVLSGNGGPWVNSPILLPRPYLARSSTEPQLPRSSPPPARSSHLRTSSISEPRPPKRTRLCADETIISPSQKVELGPSRFFASVVPDPSPSIVKCKRSKRQDVNIFSDDSIEEAMLNLPDVDGFGSSSIKKMMVFGEEKVVAAQMAQPAVEKAVTTITNLKERFAFTAGTPAPKSSASSQDLPTPSLSAPRSKIPLPVKPRVQSSPFPRSGPTLTPLQRLGVSATGRNRLPVTPPLTPVLPTLCLKPDTPRRSFITDKNTPPFPEAVRPQRQQRPLVEARFIPLPAQDEKENAALVGGSEDLMVDDSEGEESA